MIVIGAILILIALITAIVDAVDYSKSGMGISVFFATLVGTIFAITGIINKIKPESPQAIDVYRGNTTLQITYKDSVPIDTIVIFK